MGIDASISPVDKLNRSSLQQIAEGKTKTIYRMPDYPGHVLIKSKDRITAFNAERQHELEGKALLSNVTTCKVFQYLAHIGFPSHFVEQISETEFIAKSCQMIPIEWVARRVATGSFLKRNQGVPEGYRFSPPKIELFFKDDAAGDPQWSEEMLICSKMEIGNVKIGQAEVTLMSQATRVVFEVLERAWAFLGCSLIDMKVEFGVTNDGKVVLADVIDNDSWRLWPGGDRRLQLDKQFYRDLPEVTEAHLKLLKEKFASVIEKLDKFIVPPKGRVVVMAGSAGDEKHISKLALTCKEFGVPCFVRISSAHKATQETLRIAAEYEGDGVPTVFIAVAGMSNGLGPVLAGNVTWPVINCPPVENADDVWSSLRLPSGMLSSTVLSPGNAVWNAVSILGMSDHVLWSKLHVKQFLNASGLLEIDKGFMKN